MRTSFSSNITSVLRGALVAAVAMSTVTGFALNYDVQRTATAPVIDGVVDAAWSAASPAATGFVDSTGAVTVSSQQTNVRAMWDANKLYILFEATDNAIVASATANDTGFDLTTPQDLADIILDPTANQLGTRSDTIYHIAVNPATNAYTLTEAGFGQTGWNLTSASQVAFASSGSNWTVEMAIAWTDLNSKLTNSPGVVIGPPGNGSIWSAQFGRLHSAGNNVTASKWNPTAGTTLRAHPIGTLTFVGGPAATGLSMAAYTPLYTTGFESPGFTAGASIDGHEDWATSYPLSFLCSTAMAKSGTQCMEVLTSTTGQTVTGTTITGTQGVTWLQYAANLSPEMTGGASAYRHVLYLTGEYTTGPDTLGSVWFLARPASNSAGQGGNTIQINSYDNAAAENTATSVFFPGLQTMNNWAYVTVCIDHAAKTYEVWYNGMKLAMPGRSDKYGVKSRSVFQKFARVTIYSANYGSRSGYYDDLGVYTTSAASAVSDWSLFN